MSAQQRAAGAAAEILRSRAAAEAARGVTLEALGVRIKGNEVFNLNYLVRKSFATWDRWPERVPVSWTWSHRAAERCFPR